MRECMTETMYEKRGDFEGSLRVWTDNRGGIKGTVLTDG